MRSRTVCAGVGGDGRDPLLTGLVPRGDLSVRSTGTGPVGVAGLIRSLTGPLARAVFPSGSCRLFPGRNQHVPLAKRSALQCLQIRSTSS